MPGRCYALTCATAHLSQHIERLHHISLYLELKLEEFLGQLLFRLPTQLQHLPVWPQRKSQTIKCNWNADESTYPSRESSPNTAAPSTIHCARIVSGSFFWKHSDKHDDWYDRTMGNFTVDAHMRSKSWSDRVMDPSTYRGWLDRSLLCISPLLTLQAGSQLLVSAVCHLFDEVQTLLNLDGHTTNILKVATQTHMYYPLRWESYFPLMADKQMYLQTFQPC